MRLSYMIKALNKVNRHLKKEGDLSELETTRRTETMA